MILVLGGDGFVGWPTVLRLSKSGYDVMIVDNLARRIADIELECDSLTPIQSINKRIKKWEYITGKKIPYYNFDISDNYHRLLTLIKEYKPHTIIHLAEQRSAPYSMKSSYHKRYTVNNNINTTNNVLCAIVESGLDIHLVHLGTTGVYGYSDVGMTIPEGYLPVKVDVNGQEKKIEIMYPSNPGSIYHMCYDKETEILTDNGWKYFKDLSYQDKVATLNKEIDTLEYQLSSNIIEYDYNDEMIKINTRQIDLKVTPNHNLFVGSNRKYDHSKHFKLKRADYIYEKNSVLMKRNVGNWIGKKEEYFILPECEIKTDKKNVKIEKYKKIKMENWLNFFGWWLTEGSLYKNIINISQQKEYNFNEIIKSFKNLKLDRKIQTNKSNGKIIGFSIKHRQLSNYLKQFGISHEKFIPKEIKNLSKKQLKILINSMIKGDGSVCKCNSDKIYKKYYTKSKQLADDFQEIVIKCGYSSTISSPLRSNNEYVVSLSNSKLTNINLNTKRISNIYSKQLYNNKVYCCEVPNGIILVRRNGKVIWSGNSKCMDLEMFLYYNKNDRIKITDLEQGIVWGTQTNETKLHDDLINRFDYDGDYGTVLNRFLMQSQVNHPLTVYGTGGQTRAFIHIQNSVECIELAVKHPPDNNRVRIFNQTTECLNVNDIAQKISNITEAEIKYYNNPRNEDLKNDLKFSNDGLLNLGLNPITLDNGLMEEVLYIANKYKDRCIKSKIICTSLWNSDSVVDYEGIKNKSKIA